MFIPEATDTPVSGETAEVGNSRVNLLRPLPPLYPLLLPAASSQAVLSVTLLPGKEGFRSRAVSPALSTQQ